MQFEKEAVPSAAAVQPSMPSLLSATFAGACAADTPPLSALREQRRRVGSSSGGGRESPPLHTTRHVTGYAVAEVRLRRPPGGSGAPSLSPC